jgi:hypothetical protein
VPDEEAAVLEPAPAIPENAPSPADTPKTPLRERVCDSEILHNWTQDKSHDEAIFHLNIVHRTAGDVLSASGTQQASVEGHIRWM